MKFKLHLTLQSDATFGGGDGVAGLIDQEIEHDAATGLPFLRGRTLKGLLVEECANILYALEQQNNQSALNTLNEAARVLFGQAGSGIENGAIMHVGPGLLPEDLRKAVAGDVGLGKLTSAAVLESLTTIRRQTAVADETGAPAETSLRSFRVLLRNTLFVSELSISRKPSADELALLAACAFSLRRGGTGRNRGRGRLKLRLSDEDGGQDLTALYLVRFKQLMEGVGA
jgi:RAMP superfamily